MGLAVTKQEQFWEACGFGNWYRVKKFIEEDGVDVNKISYTVSCNGKLSFPVISYSFFRPISPEVHDAIFTQGSSQGFPAYRAGTPALPVGHH
jgi:hypothetical protein